MDVIDIFWNFSQDNAITELKASHTKATGRDAALIKQLQDENYELRLRVSLLIRLLIERGIFSADDFSTILNETKAKLAAAIDLQNLRRKTGVPPLIARRVPASRRNASAG